MSMSKSVNRLTSMKCDWIDKSFLPFFSFLNADLKLCDATEFTSSSWTLYPPFSSLLKKMCKGHIYEELVVVSKSPNFTHVDVRSLFVYIILFPASYSKK